MFSRALLLIIGLSVILPACGRLGFDAQTREEPVERDASIDGADNAATSLDPAVVGDLVYFDFNEPPAVFAAIDKSGARADRARGTRQTPGIYGTALDPSFTQIVIADRRGLFPANGLTVEAWVEHAGGDVAQLIYGDATEFPPTTLEYALYLTETDGGPRLAFAMQPDCTTAPLIVSADVELSEAVHLAASWDGTVVRLYQNARLLASSPLGGGCDRAETIFRVGTTASGFVGFLDEVKVSSYAKSQAQLVMSKDFDSAADATNCGNRFLEAGEDCDLDSQCCDGASCRFREQGSECSGGNCDGAGRCQQSAARSDVDAVALYTFDNVVGGVVADVAPISPALDLMIGNSSLAEIGSSSVRLLESNDMTSVAAAAKIIDAVRLAGEITVEAWVEPDLPEQGLGTSGPARIVSISASPLIRGVTLGHNGTNWVGRLTAFPGSLNGMPELHGSAGAGLPSEPVHLVFTRDSSGVRTIYENGIPLAANWVPGETEWPDVQMPLRLGNEGVNDRAWLGRYYLVALYATAFSEARVGRHFAAGPGPK